MLIVIIRNDGTGNENIANYHYTVSINAKILQSGEYKGFTRGKGWKKLIGEIARIIEEDKNTSNP